MTTSTFEGGLARVKAGELLEGGPPMTDPNPIYTELLAEHEAAEAASPAGPEEEPQQEDR